MKMSNLFVKIHRFFYQRPTLLWCSFTVLIFVCIANILSLNFVEDIASFLPQKESSKKINYAYQHLGASNPILVNIKSLQPNEDEEENRYFLMEKADIFVEALHQKDTSGLIHDIFYQVSSSQTEELSCFVIQNMPYFLEDSDYQRIDSLLTEEKIREILQNDKLMLTAPLPMMQTLVMNDPLFFSASLLKKMESFQVDNSFRVEDGYLFNEAGDEIVVVVNSNYPVSETACNGKLLAIIDEVCRNVEDESNTTISCSSFGASQVSLTNSNQIKRDSFVAILISLVFIIGFLFYFYREFRSMFMIFGATLFSGLFSLGIIAFVKNPVSIIAVGIASIIVGIAVNYPIHFLSHYKRTSNKEETIKNIVNPLLIGNITTVGAFLSLLFISSDAMKDLGLFASLLLVGTILFVLIFLPHFLRKPFKKQNSELAFRRIAEFSPETKWWLMTIIVVLTFFFYFQSSKTGFETNMHAINYMTAEQRAYFEKLTAETDTSCVKMYCVSSGKDMEHALQNNEVLQIHLSGLQKDSTLINHSGIANFIPSLQLQTQKLEQWNSFWQSRKENFIVNFEKVSTELGFSPTAFSNFLNLLNTEFQPQNSDFFNPIATTLAKSYIVENEELCMVYNYLYVDKNKTQNIENKLDTINKDIFTFTDSSIAERMVNALSSDFDYVLYICGFIVLLFLFLSFRRVEICLMAFLPLIVAWIWILGIMGVTGMKFNIVNVILATFIFGQGDDYSIFVTEGVLYEYKYGKKMLAQYKNSIILSSLLMFVGIGALIFAKHPAMRSLAEVTIVGMFSVVLMAYIIPPFIFNCLTRKSGQKRKIPITLINLARTLYALIGVILGLIYLTLCGFCLLTIGGKTDKNKLRFQKYLQNLMMFYANIIPQVSYKIINPNKEDFSKPAIMVCNHQSHLDLLYLLLLSPKIIALTNKKVWNSPVYSWILRYADYLPINSNIDENIAILKEKVAKGYSVLIFPEGTRSVDGKISRFHKGAFYLANQLQLDLLPIVLHGVKDVFTKHDYLLNKGSVTVSVLQRISVSDEKYRKNFDDRYFTKQVRQLFLAEYERLQNVHEDVFYFANEVLHNYIYKGAGVERNCRKFLSKLSNYSKFVEKIPERGSILVRNCACGEATLLLSLVKKNLQIHAVDSSENNIDIASHCVSVPANLTYSLVEDNTANYDLILDLKNWESYE